MKSNDAVEGLRLFSQAADLYDSLHIVEKQSVWNHDIAFEYASFLASYGQALASKEQYEKASSVWHNAGGIFSCGGVVTASTVISNDPLDIAGMSIASTNTMLIDYPYSDEMFETSNGKPASAPNPVQLLFPILACVIGEIEEAEIVKSKSWWVPSRLRLGILVKDEESLRRKGTTFPAGWHEEMHLPLSRSSLVPNLPPEKMTGSKIVVCHGSMVPSYQSPFVHQVFSKTDISRLRTALKKDDERQHNLSQEIQTNLESRWTVKRIKDFCLPENRFLRTRTAWEFDAIKNFLSSERQLGKSGQLHKSSTSEIGEIVWESLADSGRPGFYSVRAKKGNDEWVLEYAHPLFFQEWDSDDFTVYRLTMTLLFALDYERAASPELLVFVSKESDTQAPLLRRILGILHPSKTSLSRKDNLITEYSCELADGRLLRAKLDKKLGIESVEVDGNIDEIWTKACRNANTNIDRIRARRK